MNSLNSLKLAELRQHELRADAGRARLAAEARRARRQRSRLDWLRRIAGPRPRYARTRSAKPAAVTSMARPRSLDDLAFRLAVNGPAAMHDDLTRRGNRRAAGQLRRERRAGISDARPPCRSITAAIEPDRERPMTMRHHDHDHDHHRDGDPGHQHTHEHQGHDHRGGVVGAIRHLVPPHSHDHAELIDSATATREGLRTLGISLGGLGVTAVLQVAVLAISGSVALLADTIHNVSDALTAVPIAIAFWLGRRPADRRYTYGYGRAEDLAGIFVVAMIALSAVVAGYQAAQRLLDPQLVERPGWLAVAGLIGFAGNELVAIYRMRTGRRIGSAALVADGLHARTDGLTSLAVVGAAVGTIAGWTYADPLIGLAISAAIVNVGRHAARDIYRRLMDHTDPALVDRVEHQLHHIDGIHGIDRVRARWVGHQLHVDADVVLDAHLDLTGAHDILEDARHRLFHTIPRLADALLHANPTSETGDPHATTRHHLATSQPTG